MTNAELLAGMDEMIKDAPVVGLCAYPFKVIRDAVAELVKENAALSGKWISVDEALPEPEDEVMVAFDDGEVWSVWQKWQADEEEEDPLVYWIDPYEGKSHRVTHWMPLPKAPV